MVFVLFFGWAACLLISLVFYWVFLLNTKNARHSLPETGGPAHLHCGLEEAPLADRLGVPLLYVAPGLDGDVAAAARRILAMARLAAGYAGTRGMSPALPAAVLTSLAAATLMS
jgi:hypothetical protein